MEATLRNWLWEQGAQTGLYYHFKRYDEMPARGTRQYVAVANPDTVHGLTVWIFDDEGLRHCSYGLGKR